MIQANKCSLKLAKLSFHGVCRSLTIKQLKHEQSHPNHLTSFFCGLGGFLSPLANYIIKIWLGIRKLLAYVYNMMIKTSFLRVLQSCFAYFGRNNWQVRFSSFIDSFRHDTYTIIYCLPRQVLLGVIS